jgi:hypothetical protein
MAEESKRGVAESPDPGTEEKEVKAWDQAVNAAQKFRDETAEKAGWKRFIKEFENDYDDHQSRVNVPLVPLNLVFSWVKTEMARMYFRDPWITANPKRVEDIGAAHIDETVLNYLWQEIDLKRQVKLTLLDSLIVGHGWIKVGYTADFGIEHKDLPAKRGPGRPKKESIPVDTNEYVKAENVFAVHYGWDQVVFDPSATWPAHHNARWIAFRWVKPIRAIQNCGLYKEDAVVDLKPSEEKQAGKPTGSQNVIGWEIWDRDHGKVLTISPGLKKYLRETDWPQEFSDRDGNPFFPAAMLSFNPVPGKPYPLSDIAPIEPLVLQLITATAIELNHLKRWNRQIFTKPNLMNDEQKANFKQSVDGAIIEVEGDPNKDFFIPPYAPVQQDVYGILTQLQNWFRLISGQSEAEQGGAARTGTRTLGELRMVLQGNHSRAEERIDVLEDFLGEIARKINNVIQKKFDIPKIARIVGPRALEKAMLENRPSAKPQPGNPNAPQPYTSDFGFSWNKQDIQGDMDVDVIAGSTVPMDRESQLSLMEKLAPMIPFFGIQPGSPAARALGREVFRLIDIKSLEPIMDMADEASKNGGPPNPQAAKMQMEMQKGQMRMKNDQAKAQLQMQGQKAKTQADIMKAQADMARVKQHMQHDVLKHMLDQFMPHQQPGIPTGGSNGNQSA